MPATPTIVVHAGAGPLGSELREHGETVIQALTRVLDRAGEALQAGEDAVAVVTQAVQDLEDCEYFNAGYGAALCSDGSVELSASLMRGSDRAAGGVAGLRLIRNPIRAAAIVLESDQVLMIGERADRLALAQGAERWENSAFVTEKQQARLRASPVAKPEDRGTVGAVCLDSEGRLAAATSTGGITGQPPGRVGDSPLIGAGTWADERAAVSCTGDGEVFIRVGVARWLAAMISDGVAVEEAAERALTEVNRLGGKGGLIALDRDGRASLPFSTQAMPRGIWRGGQAAEVRLA
jgi:beta-aspartyl-peptidase (threonine type)